MHIGGCFLISSDFWGIGGYMAHKAIAGPYYISDCEADDEGECSNDLEIQQRFTADTAHLFHIVHSGYAQNDRKKNNRRDQHRDQPDKHFADQFCRWPKGFKAKPGDNTQQNTRYYLEV